MTDYLYSNGWRRHSILLSLAVKDENDPSILRTVRGPENSPVFSSPTCQLDARSYPLSASTLVTSPISPVYVL
jgi:hypothetical protein